MRKALVALSLAIILFSSCEKDADECVFIPETTGTKIQLDIAQLQDSFVNISSKAKVVALLSRYPEIRDHIFRRAEYPDDSIFINEIYHRFNNPHIDTLAIETKRVFGNLSELKEEFTLAFTNLKYYYPDFNPPRIQTLISGLDTDLLVSDSLIVVSLDYYLGSGAKYRPKIYDYLLKQYKKENIVPSCLLIYGIGERFNKTDMKDKTVLADMIAYGKAYYFTKHMLPCKPDSVLIGYAADEIKGARENQDLIWARLIENQVLYSTNHIIHQKYLGERPNTIEVGEKCPGRIGQWVGWQIVNKYAKTHTQITLPSFMKMNNANEIFKESQYKPVRKQ